jgi:threonylcarbamoyladenosine tRNA methylthiotransferase MtaB
MTLLGFSRDNRGLKLLTHSLYKGLHFIKDEFEKRIDICNSKTFSIKVSTGCTGKCSYCSIRLARGKVKSKPIDDILIEFKNGLDLGYTHFGLIGTDLGDYGKDIDSDLYELLRHILKIKGDYYLKLRNVSPRWLIPNHAKLKRLLESKKIIYLQSPVQSGSDSILALMNRGYKSDDYIAATRDLKEACPRLFLRTQIIVGFPQETAACFNASKRIVNSGIFDYIDIFRFTKREGTAAAGIFPDVPYPVIVRRYCELFLKTLFCKPIRKLKGVLSLYYFDMAGNGCNPVNTQKSV